MTEELSPEDEAFFDSLLMKRGATWLKNQMKELGIDPAEMNKSKSGGDFLSFLQGEMAELKKVLTQRSELLEKAMEMLTPEQRRELRTPPLLPKKEDGDDPLLPPKNEPPEPPIPEKKKLFGAKRL